MRMCEPIEIVHVLSFIHEITMAVTMTTLCVWFLFHCVFVLFFFCLCLYKTILQPLIRYESMAFIIFPPFILKVIMYSIFSRHYVFIEMLNCVMDPDVCHKRAGTWKPRSTSFISVFTSICLVIDTTSFAYKRPS